MTTSQINPTLRQSKALTGSAEAHLPPHEEVGLLHTERELLCSVLSVAHFRVSEGADRQHRGYAHAAGPSREVTFTKKKKGSEGQYVRTAEWKVNPVGLMIAPDVGWTSMAYQTQSRYIGLQGIQPGTGLLVITVSISGPHNQESLDSGPPVSAPHRCADSLVDSGLHGFSLHHGEPCSRMSSGCSELIARYLHICLDPHSPVVTPQNTT